MSESLIVQKVWFSLRSEFMMFFKAYFVFIRDTRAHFLGSIPIVKNSFYGSFSTIIFDATTFVSYLAKIVRELQPHPPTTRLLRFYFAFHIPINPLLLLLLLFLPFLNAFSLLQPYFIMCSTNKTSFLALYELFQEMHHEPGFNNSVSDFG